MPVAAPLIRATLPSTLIVSLQSGRLRWLCSKYVPPGQHALHQGPHAQLAGDGQRLVSRAMAFPPVAWLIASA